MKKPADVLKLAKDNNVKIVDLKFIDLPGLWQHFTVPIRELEESSLRGRVRLRRLVDPRLAGDQRDRHAGDPGPRDGGHRSVHRRSRRCR